MSNHVDNVFTIFGPAEDVTQFASTLSLPREASRVEQSMMREQMASWRFCTAGKLDRAYYFAASQSFPRLTLAISLGGEIETPLRVAYRNGRGILAIVTMNPRPADESSLLEWANQFTADHDGWVAELMQYHTVEAYFYKDYPGKQQQRC